MPVSHRSSPRRTGTLKSKDDAPSSSAKRTSATDSVNCRTFLRKLAEIKRKQTSRSA